MYISTLITLAAFLPLLFRLGLASPIPQNDIVHALAQVSYPDPAPSSGNISWIHDPSIIYEDGAYWRFSTSGNIAVATAPSITGPWTYKGALLRDGTKIHIADNQDVWAPSVSKHDGLYYVHYSVSTFGSQNSQIGVATATSLSGPWTDHGSLNLPQNSAYNLIDPFVFQDGPDNTLYFIFGSYWSGIQQFPVASSLQAVDGSIADSGSIKPIVTNSSAGASVVEGGTMYKHDAHYYLFFSIGACCNTPPNLARPGDEYRVAVCRSDTVTGPFVDREGKSCQTQNGGTVILASHGDVYAPGGQGVMRLPEGRDIIYYHYVRPSIGYGADQFQFGWNYLEWTDGWPKLVD